MLKAPKKKDRVEKGLLSTPSCWDGSRASSCMPVGLNYECEEYNSHRWIVDTLIYLTSNQEETGVRGKACRERNFEGNIELWHS